MIQRGHRVALGFCEMAGAQQEDTEPFLWVLASQEHHRCPTGGSCQRLGARRFSFQGHSVELPPAFHQLTKDKEILKNVSPLKQTEEKRYCLIWASIPDEKNMKREWRLSLGMLYKRCPLLLITLWLYKRTHSAI